jgi:hypothetical protein
MKTLAFTLRRNTVADPLTVNIKQNDLGILPEWFIDGPSTYRAVFAAPIGDVPKQVTTTLGGVFFYIVVEGGGNSFTINTMVNDGVPQEAELTDTYVEVRILDQVTQTAEV